MIEGMIAVIIAGGSGTRLWPLSTSEYPKHLLSLTGRRSLVQYTYERARTVADKVYVLTDISHSKAIKKQLPDIDDKCFLIEPGRRGTANCILLALKQIQLEDPDEPIAFIAADHYVLDTAGFTRTFKKAEKASRQQGKIVLIGVEPDYPATGFGYIKKGKLLPGKSPLYEVHSFKEKPDYKQAVKYLKSGDYLWNCSYFIGSAQTFKKEMHLQSPELYTTFQKLCGAKSRSAIEKIYLAADSNSIDYALIEKVDDLLVIPAEYDWMDLGSYGDLHKASQRNAKLNHVTGEKIELEGVENSYVSNQENKPVAVIGLNNIVVVNTKDGLLVARKDLAQQVGEVSKRFNNKTSP